MQSRLTSCWLATISLAGTCPKHCFSWVDDKAAHPMMRPNVSALFRAVAMSGDLAQDDVAVPLCLNQRSQPCSHYINVQ